MTNESIDEHFFACQGLNIIVNHIFLLRLAIDPQYTKWVPRWLLLFKMFPSYTKQIAMHELDWYAVSSHSLHTLTRFLTKLTAMQ